MSKVAILGTGVVGVTLAKGFADRGHEVTVASRAGREVEGWDGAIGTFSDAADAADIVVLAVKGSIAEGLTAGLSNQLAGKVIIDTTNPIADAPPVNGVLPFFTGPNDSLLERLMAQAPHGRWVKAFNSVGSALMVDPQLANGVRPSMFIAGDDAEANATVAAIAADFGWDVEDLGSATAARAVEPLCMLWCIPGIRNNDWMHAFKMLRP